MALVCALTLAAAAAEWTLVPQRVEPATSTAELSDVALSPDGSHLAVVVDGSRVAVWDVDRGALNRVSARR